MEWPHDPDGDEGSEGGRVYGLAILAKKVDREDFPLSFEALAAEIGHHPIRLDHSEVVPADDIFAAVETEGAESITHFHRIVAEAMRAGGYWTYDRTVERSSSA